MRLVGLRSISHLYSGRTHFYMRHCLRPRLSNQAIIFIMIADPNPNKICAILYCQYSMIQANARRPETSNFFEMQRGMVSILL